jgi:hypothetical protein
MTDFVVNGGLLVFFDRRWRKRRKEEEEKEKENKGKKCLL